MVYEKQTVQEKVRQIFFEPDEKNSYGIYLTWCGYRKCTENHIIGPRVLSIYKIVHVVSGQGTVEQEGFETTNLNAGDVFILYSGKKHHYYANRTNPWEIKWVAFNGNEASRILSQTGLDKNPFIFSNKVTPVIKSYFQNIIEAMANKDDIRRLQATGYLMLLIHKLAEQKTNAEQKVARENINEVVKKAISFIHENYYNYIDVDILCNYINYSRSYFSRNFRAISGISIPAYINKVRIETAQVLLRETSLSVLEIAYSVGIDDQFYFSKVFRSTSGMSPTEYRIKNT